MSKHVATIRDHVCMLEQDGYPALAQSLREAADRFEFLEGVVAALPKCWTLVDGKLEQMRPVVPRLVVWRSREHMEPTNDRIWTIGRHGEVSCPWFGTLQSSELADSPKAAEALKLK